MKLSVVGRNQNNKSLFSLSRSKSFHTALPDIKSIDTLIVRAWVEFAYFIIVFRFHGLNVQGV